MADMLDRLETAVAQNASDWEDVKAAIAEKGIEVTEGTPTSACGDLIREFNGVNTSYDTVTSNTMREGITAHDASGNEIVGEIPDYDGSKIVEITSPEGATLNTAGRYCENDIEVIPKLQVKTAMESGVVTADKGYAGLKSVDTTPVFEAGKKNEYDAFWNSWPSSIGQITVALYAGDYWNNVTFKPPTNLVANENINYAFYSSKISGDLREIAKENNITISFDSVVMLQSTFSYSLFTFLPPIPVTYVYESFLCAKKLIGIEKLIVHEGTMFVRSFVQCTSLEYLTIEGTIGQNGFNISWSPLNKASLTSIVNALSDTTTGLTVTLRLSAVNTAFETSEGAEDGSASDEWTALAATKSNWTINLIDV